jgi:hypothetical protein
MSPLHDITYSWTSLAGRFSCKSTAHAELLMEMKPEHKLKRDEEKFWPGAGTIFVMPSWRSPLCYQANEG